MDRACLLKVSSWVGFELQIERVEVGTTNSCGPMLTPRALQGGAAARVLWKRVRRWRPRNSARALAIRPLRDFRVEVSLVSDDHNALLTVVTMSSHGPRTTRLGPRSPGLPRQHRGALTIAQQRGTA
eukprot:TRINITY_DN1892_c1_g1_i3.p1 TRINITY_DN1892_c1_g1~~TRINITY_DN1892_c1_g1_i3.p1  ORF type:complete len:127 (+),score=7.42 TRINITY_DN1892_c1_g1_i3:177-557(+)